MDLFQLIYLMLPAYIANMAPVLAKNKFKPLDYPIDGGKTFMGKPILGSHKTMRGILLGIICAITVFYIQQILFRYEAFQSISLIDYNLVGPLLGFYLGFGSLVGDAVGSFIKRRFNVRPGYSVIGLDQLDFAVGALYFMAFIYHPGWETMGYILAITFVLHIVVHRIGYHLKINKKKW